MRKQLTVLLNAKNKFYECSKQIRIYSKHDVQRANFINVERFYQSRNTNLFIVKFKHEKAFRFGVRIQKTRFHQVFYEKTGNDFLNSEQKIIYIEKRVNNFLNNAKQKNNFMQNARNSLCRKQ